MEGSTHNSKIEDAMCGVIPMTHFGLVLEVSKEKLQIINLAHEFGREGCTAIMEKLGSQTRKRSNAPPSYGDVNVTGAAGAAEAAGSAVAVAQRALMAAVKFCAAWASMVCHCD